MVGFVIGVVTMWLFRADPEQGTPVEPEAVPEVAEEALVPEPPETSFEVVAALFDTYRDWAWWSDDKTQIAVWNTEAMAFSDRVEVIRTLEADYFRPIEQFTRLPLPGYGPENSPILFTETAEQRAKREIELNPDLAPKPERPSPIEFNTLPPPPSGG